jgi:hypothetical protein
MAPFRNDQQTPFARRRRLRLTPLIVSAAVGAGGLLTLFLLIGSAPIRP